MNNTITTQVNSITNCSILSFQQLSMTSPNH